ncbi:MAG: hypothetical protein CM15mP41_2350 [Flammeovirgaceae bacterium]|nr:MAG: hypothetical protein CM15mP41_2350 [Flammeovirgaceae bacterium]
MPFVPPTIGAILINGTYLLAFSPIHRATLFTPDILENQHPLYLFATNNIFYLGIYFVIQVNLFASFYYDQILTVHEVLYLP